LTCMADARQEAIEHLSAVVRAILEDDADLVKLMRRCALACRLLRWDESVAWCEHELNRYPYGAELPGYRASVIGFKKWLVEGGIHTAIEAVITDSYRTRSAEPEVQVQMTVPYSVDLLVSLSKTGHDKPTGHRRERMLERFRTKIGEYEVERYSAEAFKYVLRGLESELFAFASDSYAVLKYEDAVEGALLDLQQTAAGALLQIGLSSHFQAIADGLASDNRERWRQAMNECRNALQELARFLWQDPRSTYDLLRNGRGCPLQVADDKFANRLRAYLHQKGLSSGKQGQYILTVLEETAATIRALADLESTAHAPVKLMDVQMAAVGTYLVLAQLAARTDLHPIACWSYDVQQV